VGVGTGQAELIELQESIERSLNPLGFPRENRRFHAHLTIGRVRSAGPQSDLAKLIQEQAAFEAGTTIVDEVVTFASYLDKTGPTYEALGRAPLNG
jgi:2'-5' RNA ligase